MWRVGADKRLRVVERDEWDGDAARARIFAWAGWDDEPDAAKARRAFLVYDDERPDEKAAYKLPFADVVDDELVAVSAGLRAAASRLPQTDIPEDVRARARAVLDTYFERLRERAKALRVKVHVPAGAHEVVRDDDERAKRGTLTFDALDGAPQAEALGVPFGGHLDGRDADGEAFHEHTDTWLVVGDEVPVTYYHGMGPDAPGTLQRHPARIGVARVKRVDARGWWFDVRFDAREPLAQRVIDALESGREVKASSGAVAHLVRTRADGLIDVWPVGELAIFDTNEWRRPANELAIVRAVESEPEAAHGAAASEYAGAEMKAVETNVKEVEMTEELKQNEQQAQQPAVVDAETLARLVAEAAKRAAEEVAERMKPQEDGRDERRTPRVGVVKSAPAVLRHGLGEPDPADSDTPLLEAVKGLRRGQFTSVLIPAYRGASKALVEGTNTAGGYLVPEEHAAQFIEMLSARAVVRRAGATVLPMRTDVMNVPKQSGGATAYWVAENTAITESDAAFGQVTLTAKKAAALARVSAELLADSTPSAEAIVREDLARALALFEDLSFLRGYGTGASPIGMLNYAGVVKTQLGSGNGATPTLDDLLDAIYRLDAADAPEESRVWVMHPRTAYTLRQVKDSQGRYLWADPARAGEPPTLWGYPVFTTTQIPVNLTVGTSTDCSEIYIFAAREVLIGQRAAIELRASDTAGTAFETDTVLIRAIERVAFGLRHPESVQILTGVRP